MAKASVRLHGVQELFIPQPGPIARKVADLALAMKVFASTSMSTQPDLVPPVPWSGPDLVQVDGLRLGMYVDNGFFPVSPGVRRAVDEAAGHCGPWERQSPT